MSIVVAFMNKDEGVWMCGDKKVIKTQNSRFSMSNDFVKVKKLSPSLACGITGQGSWQKPLLDLLEEKSNSLPSELILVVKDFSFLSTENGNIILGGLYDDEAPFLWVMSINTDEPDNLFRDGDPIIISTDGDEFKNECAQVFMEELDSHNTPHLACVKTIQFASEKKPDIISSAYNLFFCRQKPR